MPNRLAVNLSCAFCMAALTAMWVHYSGAPHWFCPVAAMTGATFGLVTTWAYDYYRRVR